MAVPLYQKFPLIDVPGTFVSIRLEDFLILLTSIFWGITVLPSLKFYLKNKITIALGIYILVSMVSVASAMFITKTAAPHIAMLHLLRRIEYFMPFFMGYTIILWDRDSLKYYLKVLMIVVIAVFIYGFGQKHYSWPIIITQNEEYSKGIALRWIEGSHINSTFAGHYDLATFLVLALPILISSLFLLKGPKIRALLVLTIFAGIWLLINAASRISILSYLLATTTALILVKKYRAIVIVILVSVILVGFSSNLMARYLRVFDLIQKNYTRSGWINVNLKIKDSYAATGDINLPERVNPTPTPPPVFEDRSTSIRLNVEWPRALRAFSKNPLLGTGFSSITLATDNDYLRLLGETGILGLLAFFLIFLRLGEKIISNLPFDKHFSFSELAFVSGVTGALGGIFINGIFIDIFEASKFAIIFWLFIGMASGLLRDYE